MNMFKSFFCISLALAVSFNANAEVQILLDENFDSGVVKNSGFGVGGQHGGVVGISTDKSEVLGKTGGSLKAAYPKGNGGIYGWASFDMRPYKTYEVYIEFHAKMPKAKQGIKFLKIFGGANTTFGLDYTGVASGKGSLYQVSFGDGTTTSNDTQNVINLNGAHPSWIGRSYGKAVVKTPENIAFFASQWEDKWHHFRFKVKFNSATKNADGSYTEINDGEYLVQIDGRTYVDAKGLLNRHPTNGPITHINLLDWSQNVTEEFEIWYDNVRITLGGFYTGNDPSADKMFPKYQ